MKYLRRFTSVPESTLDVPENSIIQFAIPSEEEHLILTGETKESEIEKDINDLLDAINDNVAKIEYSSLVISCPNVYYYDTTTKINYTYHKDYLDSDGNIIKYNEIKGSAISESFDVNDSYSDYQTRTINFEIAGLFASVDIIQGVKNDVDFGNNIPVGNYNNLIITADNVTANKTTTTIHYTIGYSYITAVNSTIQTDGSFNGSATSSSFEKNTLETETVEIPISYSINGLSANTTITQGVYIPSDLIIGTNNIDTSDTTKQQYTYSNRTGRLYSFIAPETKTYTFSFNDNVTGGSSMDTYGYMFNESLGTSIASDDDSASNSDPKWTYSCTAGTKYYVLLTPYSTGSSATVKGILTIS